MSWLRRVRSISILAAAVCLGATVGAFADPAADLAAVQTAIGDHKIALDTLWVLVTAMLVFFMNLGFALVESGLCQAKNCVNILSKNFIVFAASSLAFWVLGWGVMFGNGSGFMGTEGL